MGFTASSPALYIFSILSNSCSALLAANMPCLDLAQQSMQELYVTSRRKVSTQQDKIRICNDGIINSHLNLASTFHLLLLILPPNDEEVSLLANLHCCRQCPPMHGLQPNNQIYQVEASCYHVHTHFPYIATTLLLE